MKRECKFKVGDWVVTNGYSKMYDGKVLRINRVSEVTNCYWFDQSVYQEHNFGEHSARLAFPHEIPLEFRKTEYYYY